MHFVIDLGCQIDEMRCEENFSISCLKASGKLRINRVTHLWIAVARISIGFCYFWPPLFFSRGDESTYLIKTLRDFQEFVWSALQQKSQCLKIRQKVTFYNIASEASYVYFKIQTLTMQIGKWLDGVFKTCFRFCRFSPIFLVRNVSKFRFLWGSTSWYVHVLLASLAHMKKWDILCYFQTLWWRQGRLNTRCEKKDQWDQISKHARWEI